MTITENSSSVIRQYGKLRDFIAAGQWTTAKTFLLRVNEDRPYLARVIAQLDLPPVGMLATGCIVDPRAQELLTLFLHLGSDPNWRSPAGEHLMLLCMREFRSTRDSNLILLKTVLQHGGDPNAVGDLSSGRSLLHWAIINKRAIFVPELLKFGADPERLSDSGQNAFDLAMQHSNSLGIIRLKDWKRENFEWEL